MKNKSSPFAAWRSLHANSAHEPINGAAPELGSVLAHRQPLII